MQGTDRQGCTGGMGRIATLPLKTDDIITKNLRQRHTITAIRALCGDALNFYELHGYKKPSLVFFQKNFQNPLDKSQKPVILYI